MAGQAMTPTPKISSNGTTDSPDMGKTKQISFGITGFFLFAGVLVTLVCVRKKCTKQRKRHGSHSQSSRSSCESNQLSEIMTNDICVDRNTDESVLCDDLKDMMKGYIIEANRLILEKVIGKGQFGCVYEGFLSKDPRGSNNYGILTHERVAVKTIKTATVLDTETVEAFLQEGMIMKDFCHPNVLGLIGVAIGDRGIPMIVLPFMENGNLKKYISDPTRNLVVGQLLDFGRQVAHGMDYLGQQKFVHRDLAARNCMLDTDMVVKVADFGLSRDIYTKDYYSSEDRQAKLPVKWMAIECLSKSKYTYRSDVWSFGVLLWELLTRGATPYPDVSNWDVFKYIKSGRRMRQPEACPDEIFLMMEKCWREIPTERPTFLNLAKDFDAILGPRMTQRLSEHDNTADGTTSDYMNLYMNVEAPDGESPTTVDVTS